MTVVAVVLAGGTSRRMGQDKATMYGGVERLKECLAQAGIQRCVTLCGQEHRKPLFTGEVIADPPHINGLHRIIPWIREEVNASILLVPCDAFLLTSEAVGAFLKAAPNGGVPSDDLGRRQPLFAYLPRTFKVNEGATSVMTLLQELPTVNVPGHGAAFSNFNRPSDLQRPELLDRQP